MSIPRFLRSALAAVLASASMVGAESATAATSTVPGEVALYISTELIDDLNEYYGPGTGGNGRLFTNTTTVSGGIRIYEFTSDFSAGAALDPAVRRLNEWVSVVSIDEAPVGFALVEVEPVTSTPQLVSFTESVDFGVVVSALAETAKLVRDDDRAAWFSLDGEQLTPLVAGASGIIEPVSLADYQRIVVTRQAAIADAAPELANPNTGLAVAGLILVALVLLLALEAFFPFWRRRARQGVAADDDAGLPAPVPESALATVAPEKPRALRKKPDASS